MAFSVRIFHKSAKNKIMYTYLADKNKPDQVSIISQDEIIRRITGDEELKTEVSEIRRLTKRYEQSNDLADRNEKEAQKTKLPAFVPAGEFSHRKTHSLTKYWGRIVMDIDHIKDPERLRAMIKSNHEPSVIMAFLSPSGTGLKVIHQLEYPELKSIEETVDFHKQAFVSLINLYKSKYRVTEIDLSGSDLCRLCYYSYDDKAYYNPDAKGWAFVYNRKSISTEPNLNSRIEGYYLRFNNDDEHSSYSVVQNIIKWCVSENISLLEHYNDWIKAMFVLKNSFSYSNTGLELFLQLSSTSSKFRQEECIKKWQGTMVLASSNKATLGTLIYMARQNGWRPPKNLYVGPNSKLNSLITAMEESNIRLKYNELTHQLYYSESADSEAWALGDDYMAGKISLAVLGGALKKDDLFYFINYIPPKYNPVKDFLSSLPIWDGQDRFPDLVNTLTLKTRNDANMVKTLLRKWLIGVINGLHNRPENYENQAISPNENLLIIIGMQGIGKTRWMRKLVPEKWYNTLFAEKLSFDFSNKDDELLTCEKAIIAMDELSPILHDKASNEQLKGFLSQKTFNTRVAYGRFNSVFYKIASFIGTSNQSEIITDPTGSRRFWPIEIVAANYCHSIDMEQLWAQTYKLWKDGEKHWLSAEEQAELSLYNVRFTKIHPYEEYINRFITRGKDCYTATEICEFINSELDNNAVNARQLGVYLKKAGYESELKWRENKAARLYSNILLLPKSTKKEFEELKEKTRITVKKLRKKDLEELDDEEGQRSAELYQV